MSAVTRVCPSCSTILPPDAAFCHKCGSATPQETDRETGAIRSVSREDLAEAARRAKLQSALGDSCEVRRLLGRGGFAEVYVAYDKRLKREIAVKTIRGDLVATEMLLERFQREAEAVAKLRHPNVIPIYSVGESEGTAYFTMPMIEGESLADALEHEGKIPAGESVRILREAAHALHAAHRAGLVHRDIKPENIMLEGPERSVVVMDFGIAKIGDPTEKGLTGTAMLIGTPQYMSPEQAVGERTLDARSDQYALAMVGYRMFAGRLPFEGSSIQTQIVKTITEPAPPLVETAPEVPKPVSDAIAKALAKNPDDRFESMAAFAEALGVPTHAEAVAAARRRTPDIATRTRGAFARIPRLRSPLVVLGVVGLLLAAVLVPRYAPPPAMAVAADREDAVFAARAFLNARGAHARRSETVSLVAGDSVYLFLQRALGPKGANRAALGAFPLWHWEVTLRGSAENEFWMVSVGPENRVMGFTHIIPATATAPPPVSSDRALVLAQQELVARGWSLAALDLLPDYKAAYGARSDTRFFTWRQRGVGIPWRGADSAYVTVNATVKGSAVSAYGTGVNLPESYKKAFATPLAEHIVHIAGVVALVILLGIGVVAAIARQRTDELPWRMILVAVVTGLIMYGAPSYPKLIQGFAESQSRQTDPTGETVAFIGLAIVAALGVSVVVLLAASGESLASEERPGLVLGLRDMTRGRLLVPEWVPAGTSGLLLGLTGAGAAAVLTMAGQRFGDTASTLTPLFSESFPTFGVVASYGLGILVIFALLWLVAYLANHTATAWAALVLPAILWASVDLDLRNPLAAVAVAVTTFVAALAMWRYGFLAGVVAWVVASTVSGIVELFASGSSEFMFPAIVSVALILAPPALAFLAYRRYGTVPTLDSSRDSTRAQATGS